MLFSRTGQKQQEKKFIFLKEILLEIAVLSTEQKFSKLIKNFLFKKYKKIKKPKDFSSKPFLY